MIEQIGGWWGFIDFLIVPGFVAMPLGLTVPDVVSKSAWSLDISLLNFQLLSIVLIWLLIIAWVAPDVFSRR